jgi:hypothetical protein
MLGYLGVGTHIAKAGLDATPERRPSPKFLTEKLEPSGKRHHHHLLDIRFHNSRCDITIITANSSKEWFPNVAEMSRRLGPLLGVNCSLHNLNGSERSYSRYLGDIFDSGGIRMGKFMSHLRTLAEGFEQGSVYSTFGYGELTTSDDVTSQNGFFSSTS